MNKEDIKISEMLDLSETDYSFLFKGLTYPFEVLPLIKQRFDECVKQLNTYEYNRIKDGVYVHKSVTVLKSVYLGRNIIIGRDVDLRNAAFLRENVIIGDKCVVGNSCELKNVLMFNKAKAPHFNYVGDTVMGYNSHIGAGVKVSNLKLDESNIVLKVGDETLDTKLRKFGAIIGDNAQVGCNAVLNPGTILGKNTFVYPLTNVRGVITKNCICKSQDLVVERK
ncbi:MAG: UDP-N-acetylglucosamine pyrophosphorylase [Lachnospiraceae bacterium]|nr:UDP-N-acetylglucosamine pyrophosphorylase [Lachnospiraceae bacterium]